MKNSNVVVLGYESEPNVVMDNGRSCIGTQGDGERNFTFDGEI